MNHNRRQRETGDRDRKECVREGREEAQTRADNKTKVATKSRRRIKTLKAIKFHANKLIRKS